MTAGVIGVTAGSAGAATTANALTATTATNVIPTGKTQAGANLHVTFVHTADATTLTLTESSTGGTVKFKAAPTVSAHAGFTTATPTLEATGKVVKVALAQATPHTTEKVTFSGIVYTTTGATGHVHIAASSTPAETFTGSPVNDANVTGGPSSGNGITASSSPKISKTGSEQSSGTLTITLRGTAATAAATTFLNVRTSVGKSGNAFWANATLSSTTVTASFTTNVPSSTNVTNPQVTIKLGHLATGHAATVHLKSVRYNTVTAVGTVTVSPAWVNSTTDATASVSYGSFTPASAVNAFATTTTPPTQAPAADLTVHATATPNLKNAASGQVAGTWTITFANVTKGKGWFATEDISIEILNHTDQNCTTASHGFVLFTGTPTAKVTTSTHVSATPTLKVGTSNVAPCTGLSHNVVTVIFTNSGTFTTSTVADNTMKITVSGIKYTTKAGTAPEYGNVAVTAKEGATAVGAANTTTTAPGESNAAIVKVFVTADTPAITLAPSAYDAKISPISIVENQPDQVAAGYVCINLLTSTNATVAKRNSFNASNTATAKASVGTGTVTSKVTYENKTGAAVTSGTAKFALFDVKSHSVTKDTTYTVTGLAVDASNQSGAVTATVAHANSSTDCATQTLITTKAVAYSISIAINQVYGTTADATAARLLETRYTTLNHTVTHGTCIGSTVKTTITAFRPVVLSTTKTYKDALSSQYLAGYDKTGTLLTPTGKTVATPTMQALKFEGVTNVIVVGGPLAVTTTVVTALETTPAYACGGTHVLTTATGTRYLKVTRIAGTTQYQTAQKIAESVPVTSVKKLKFVGAYSGVNATKGDGAYNTTAGTASTAPSSGGTLETAILANGATEYQDAMAASALAYGTSLPVLLTTTTKLSTSATQAFTTLHIGQVIVMGGQLAITNTQVTALEKAGISVLRIAGANYTNTAVELAEFEVSARTVSGVGWTGLVAGTIGHPAAFTVARGNGFTDGLTGAVWSGFKHLPLLLTLSPEKLGTGLTAFLKQAGTTGPSNNKGIDDNGTTLKGFTVFGGPLAVTPTEIKQMEADIG